MSTKPAESKAQPSILVADAMQSKVQPLWHVAVLNVFTMFTYSIVWFYKTWKDLAVHAQAVDRIKVPADPALKHFQKISPTLLTIGALVPILQLFLTSMLFYRIAQLYPVKDSPVHKRALLMAIVLTAAMVGLLCLSSLPEGFRLLYLFAAVPLIVVQHWVNAYWRTQEPPEAIVRHAFSTGELVSLILGAVLLGLNVTGLVVH